MKMKVESIVKQPAGYYEVGVMYPPLSKVYTYMIPNARDIAALKFCIKKGYTNRIIKLIKKYKYTTEV